MPELRWLAPLLDSTNTHDFSKETKSWP